MYIKVMEKEILNEKDVLENYFYLIVTYVYKYNFTIRFFLEQILSKTDK
jgi:hypothetical protein